MSNLDGTIGLSRFAGLGAWNDLDMLEVRHAALVADRPGKNHLQRRTAHSTQTFYGQKPCLAHKAVLAIHSSALFTGQTPGQQH